MVGCDKAKETRASGHFTIQGVTKHVPSQVKPLSYPPHQGAKGSKPKRILLRGESLKINMTIGTIPGGAESEWIKRLIFPEKEKYSKNATNKTRGNNQGIIIAKNPFPISLVLLDQ